MRGVLPSGLAVHCLTWLCINQDFKSKTHTNSHAYASHYSLQLRRRKKGDGKYLPLVWGWVPYGIKKHGPIGKRHQIPLSTTHIMHQISSFVAESFRRQIKMKSLDELNESNKEATKQASKRLQTNKRARRTCNGMSEQWRRQGHRCEVSTCDAILVHNIPISIVAGAHTHIWNYARSIFSHSLFRTFKSISVSYSKSNTFYNHSARPIDRPICWISVTFNVLIE